MRFYKRKKAISHWGNCKCIAWWFFFEMINSHIWNFVLGKFSSSSLKLGSRRMGILVAWPVRFASSVRFLVVEKLIEWYLVQAAKRCFIEIVWSAGLAIGVSYFLHGKRFTRFYMCMHNSFMLNSVLICHLFKLICVHMYCVYMINCILCRFIQLGILGLCKLPSLWGTYRFLK